MSDAPFDPKYVTFDCYGTLIHWEMSRKTVEVLGDRLPADLADPFNDLFEIYRGDEVMSDWIPYRDIIRRSLSRAGSKLGVPVTEADADAIWDDIPAWGPNPDVPDGLARLAERVPLVILSNASDAQIPANVARLGAPFHAVLTSEQAQAYKPRLAAFEYMLDTLGCNAEDVVHVSSSMRYDLMPADNLGIRNKVYVNRGWEPSQPAYRFREITGIDALPALFGI